MRRTKTKFLIIMIVFFSLVVTNQAVFAEDTITVNVSPANLAMQVIPEVFSSASQTITVSATSSAGYNVSISPTGSSNALINQADSSYSIPTFTLPNGVESLPANSTGYGYGYSIDNGLNYLPVPEPGASKKIYETSSSGTNNHTLTFGALVPMEKPQGSYTNSVAIIVVANLQPCLPNRICYYGNDDDKTGIMPEQTVGSNTEVTLIPPNYSRPGYGFVGWNTAIDGTGTNYGPNEKITTGDLASEGLQLYANWTPSTGNFQNWNGCGEMNPGDVTALTDTRDNSTYAVGKFVDGQCWMMENLRLDLSDQDLEINGFNTNRPTSAFINSINNNRPISTNNFCDSSSASCVNRILFNSNNTNRNLTASYDANDTSSSWYSYGNYYNWHTITAGNGTYEDSTAGASVNGDICPSNWKLPTGYGTTGDLSKLDVALGGSGKNQASGTPEGALGSIRWRKYPLNFIYSGEQKGNTSANRAISSSYATQNIANIERTDNLWLRTDGVYMNSNITYKYRGQTARCVFKGVQKVNGNIHYDANGGTGTMADAVDIDFYTATASSNEFTKQYAVFAGWNTKSNGTGVTVAEGGLVANAAESMSLTEGETLTLYAIWENIYSLTYDGNGADDGSMASVSDSQLKAGKMSLIAPNYARADYGFAGWSLDQDASTKLASGTPVTIYGPNETVMVDTAFLSHANANNQITLYAVWLPKDTNYTLQTFGSTECSTMNIGEVMALEDIRDNNTYTIAKLEDGNCWTIENLRLVPTTTSFDSSNTNLPTQQFIEDAPNSLTSNNLCNTDNDACVDKIQFNTNNIILTNTASHNSNTVNKSWYSYGVMYNWYTASAGNGVFLTDTGNVTGDICPAGWRLPTGGNNSEFTEINRLANNNSTAVITGLTKYPDNFILSGDYNNKTPGGRSSYGRYWSATPDGTINAFRLGFASNTNKAVTPAGSWNKWDAFAVRCIVK